MPAARSSTAAAVAGCAVSRAVDHDPIRGRPDTVRLDLGMDRVQLATAHVDLDTLRIKLDTAKINLDIGRVNLYLVHVNLDTYRVKVVTTRIGPDMDCATVARLVTALTWAVSSSIWPRSSLIRSK